MQLLPLILFCFTASADDSMSIDLVAQEYTRLVLAVGEHDPDYVDAYYGPPEWREEEKQKKRPLKDIRESGVRLLSTLEKLDRGSEEMAMLRHQYLTKQLESMIARIEMLEGRKFTFDEESKALYDAVSPSHPESYYNSILDELEKILPGDGRIHQRYDEFRRKFIIPKELVDTVFRAAVAEARGRTSKYIQLPVNESFTLEYVTGKVWSGYNWYKGNSQSLIQINIELPIYIDRAVDLAVHEGYPGHHVYNALLEQELVRKRKWMEFSVYALYSPQSLIAEGSANYGIEVVFPMEDRLEFEKKTLFPLAGLDPSSVSRYYEVQKIVAKLSYAGNEAARDYLDGKMSRVQAVAWIQKYGPSTPERAEQRVRFIEKNHSYVINYNYGQDLVKSYIESRGGTEQNPEKRWQEFMNLLASPRLPSGLRR